MTINTSAEPTLIRRYTDFGHLIYLYTNRGLLFGTPNQWPDKIDRENVEAYKRHQDFLTIRAVCFNSDKEKHHHWEIYGGTSCSLCVEFDYWTIKNLVKESNQGWELRMDTITYLDKSTLLDDSSGSKFQIKDLPFTKRDAFCDENEVRIIAGHKSKLNADFVLYGAQDTVRRIQLGPNVPFAIQEAIIKTLHDVGAPKDIILSSGFNNDWPAFIFRRNLERVANKSEPQESDI